MILHPKEIENESMRIIRERLKPREFPPDIMPVIMRVIHATADFDFADTLYFSENVIAQAHEALRKHTPIITDTLMLASGISKNYGVKILCYSSDEATRTEAQARNITRAIVNIERSVRDYPGAIYAIGNAPTALIRLCELIREGRASPALVVGVPVGFVNVIEAKNELSSLTDTPRIIASGNKGGTTTACAIMNALLYGLA